MSGSVGSEDGDMGFQIAPMVDVVFVLMLFFMACAGSQIRERELSIALPAHGGGGPAAIVIDIAADGRVLLNDRPLGEVGDHELASLRVWFKEARERFGSEDPVIIRPNPGTRHERIIDVLNATSAAGVKNLSFS